MSCALLLNLVMWICQKCVWTHTTFKCYTVINEKRVIPTATTKIRLEINARYLAKFDAIRARVPKGDLQKYKDFAAANGYSLNALVVGLLKSAMDGTIPLPPKK